MGQRSLVRYSLWGHKESDTTEQLTLSFTFTTKVPAKRDASDKAAISTRKTPERPRTRRPSSAEETGEAQSET